MTGGNGDDCSVLGSMADWLDEGESMNHDELRQAAVAALSVPVYFAGRGLMGEFHTKARPDVVIALLEENAALRAQLRKYGRHLSECVFNQPWDDDDPALCTCGFIEHLREILGDAS